MIKDFLFCDDLVLNVSIIEIPTGHITQGPSGQNTKAYQIVYNI